MRFINEEDLNEESFARFCEEISEIRRTAKKRHNLLAEQPMPKFNTVEEARKYFESTPFEEWENKVKEKYGF
ncbi:MAG: hypothetical protein K2L17_07725 [Muribaculaceae bacterium]|nr:hypothetical protein [Muribaculaceae bacterium]